MSNISFRRALRSDSGYAAFGRPDQVSNAGSLPDLNTKYAYDLIDVP